MTTPETRPNTTASYGADANTFDVFYSKDEHFRGAIMGDKPDPRNLDATHVLVASFERSRADDLAQMEHVFMILNIRIGQTFANHIKELGLRHTSMSVGDVILNNGRVWLVAPVGFEDLGPID